jgi:hypothetical protein
MLWVREEFKVLFLIKSFKKKKKAFVMLSFVARPAIFRVYSISSIDHSALMKYKNIQIRRSEC